MPVIEVVVAALGFTIGGERAWRKLRGLPEEDGVYDASSCVLHGSTHSPAICTRIAPIIHRFFTSLFSITHVRTLVSRTDVNVCNAAEEAVDLTNSPPGSPRSPRGGPAVSDSGSAQADTHPFFRDGEHYVTLYTQTGVDVIRRERFLESCSFWLCPVTRACIHDEVMASSLSILLSPQLVHIQTAIALVSPRNRNPEPPLSPRQDPGQSPGRRESGGGWSPGNAVDTFDGWGTDRDSVRRVGPLLWIQRVLGGQGEEQAAEHARAPEEDGLHNFDKLRQAIRSLAGDQRSPRSPLARPQEDGGGMSWDPLATPRSSALKRAGWGADSPMQSPRYAGGPRRVRFDRKNMLNVIRIYDDAAELESRRWLLVACAAA
jgi:hypothetical protein